MTSPSATLFADLVGKTIWVTGGAGYLGAPITAALDRAAARTLCFDLGDKPHALARSGARSPLPSTSPTPPRSPRSLRT